MREMIIMSSEKFRKYMWRTFWRDKLMEYPNLKVGDSTAKYLKVYDKVVAEEYAKDPLWDEKLIRKGFESGEITMEDLLAFNEEYRHYLPEGEREQLGVCPACGSNNVHSWNKFRNMCQDCGQTFNK